MRRFLIVCLAMLPVGTASSRAGAAGHHEITVIPVGPAHIESGTHDVSYRLPIGPKGVLPQPIIFIGAQPRLSPPQGSQPAEQAPQAVQVPATLRFTVSGKTLPAWEMQPYPTAYVISHDVIAANSDFSKERLALEVTLASAAKGVRLTLLGMPDLLLLDSPKCGPLASLAGGSADVEVRAYLIALATEIAGEKTAARDAYTKLRDAKNARVGRFARRSLRMHAYDLRQRRLSGNFMEHYRWGLYLQQCGLSAGANAEFEECRILYPGHADSQYRAGETLERNGGFVYKVLPYMDRAGEAAGVAKPNRWHVLVTTLRSRGEVTLTGEQMRFIKDQCLLVEQMVWAASGARLWLVVSFFDIKDESARSFVKRPGGAYAPSDDIVETRGWFDGVISVVPRLGDGADPPGRTVGGDLGPNGAALSSIYHDASWEDYMAALYEQITWAAWVGEIGRGIPFGDEALSCGHRPAAHNGAACRAALRYHFAPVVFNRLKICDAPAPNTAAQLWKIEGPYPVAEATSGGEGPGHYVLDSIPSGPAPKTIHHVSETDFVDLAALLPDAGRALARATCWVYAPEDREVRMWLGQNDGMAVWLNGRCIHTGEYYSAGNFEDKNLVDTLAAFARLKKGWNELRVVVESWPAPRDRGWGFSVRFCTWDNRAVPGLAYTNRRPKQDLAVPYAPPKAGPYYVWQDVRHDYHELLPVLGASDLAALTGVADLRVEGAVLGMGGCVAITASGQPASKGYRPLTRAWQPDKDRDVVLNNVLDWARESCAAYRFSKDGKVQDLLLVKPEALEAYLTLLNEPAAAKDVFEGRPPAARLLGTVTVPAGASNRTLFAVATLLSGADDGGQTEWPIDEEDLLTPFGETVSNTAAGLPNAKTASSGPSG